MFRSKYIKTLNMRNFTALLTFILFTQSLAFAIQPERKYWVKLTDKQHNTYNTSNPEAFLSERAIERRDKWGMAIDSTDLPVSPYYLDSIQKIGASIVCTSKWLNAVTISTYDDTNSVIETISNLSFVDTVILSWSEEYLKNARIKFRNEEMVAIEDLSYGFSYPQVAMHNADLMHNEGYNGNGILIAVIDNGFRNLPELSSLQHLFADNRILGTRDFVNPGGSVYTDASEYNHGTTVLSCIASYEPDTIIGTAYNASFWLMRTEDGYSEQPVEMDYWIAGAELADSVGADVINSSLGYYDFDDPFTDYTYEDMDGQTTRVTLGANIAVRKGIVVTNSVGNEGNIAYGKLIAPSDGVNVIAVGSVNKDKSYTSFSSRGYSADGRVKPDVMAVGYQAVAQSGDGKYYYVNGTSFSSPITCGLAAILLQARPDLSSFEIAQTMQRSADRFDHPNDSFGYGIPDIYAAKSIHLGTPDIASESQSRISYPNPFKNKLYVKLPEALPSTVMIHDLSGKRVWEKNISASTSELVLPETMANGVYILQVHSGSLTFTELIVKHE